MHINHWLPVASNNPRNHLMLGRHSNQLFCTFTGFIEVCMKPSLNKTRSRCGFNQANEWIRGFANSWIRGFLKLSLPEMGLLSIPFPTSCFIFSTPLIDIIRIDTLCGERRLNHDVFYISPIFAAIFGQQFPNHWRDANPSDSSQSSENQSLVGS